MSTQLSSGLYNNYLNNVQRYYEREPLVRASLQLLLSVFAVVFFSFVAIRPTLTTITTLLKKIEDQKIADGKLTTKLTQLAEAQQFLSDTGEELTTLSAIAIPSEPNIKRLSQEIELSANQSGVLITQLTFEPTPLVGSKSTLIAIGSAKMQTTDPKQFVFFNLTVGGGQAELVDFLDKVGRLDRVITITDLVFSKPQAGSKVNLPLTASIKGTAYYLVPKPVVTSLTEIQP